MKKMKKMFAIVLGTLLALIPVMSLSIVSKAATNINGVIEWYDRDTEEYFATTSCVLSVAEDSGDYEYYGHRREADAERILISIISVQLIGRIILNQVIQLHFICLLQSMSRKLLIMKSTRIGVMNLFLPLVLLQLI